MFFLETGIGQTCPIFVGQFWKKRYEKNSDPFLIRWSKFYILKWARNSNLESYLLAACCSLFSNFFFCLLLPVVTRFVCSSILYTFRRKLIEHKVKFFLVMQFSFSLWKGVGYFLKDPYNNNRKFFITTTETSQNSSK